MRLIDADAFEQKINHHIGGLAIGIILVGALRNEPTVDAVPVVRCRECKYHNKAPCPMRLSLNWTNDNDFCSYGERIDQFKQMNKEKTS